MKKVCLCASLLILSLISFAALPQKASSIGETSKACQVHGEILKPDKVRVTYGHFNIDLEWLNEGEKLFPNSNQFILGGCKSPKDVREDGTCFRKGGAKYEEVFYCEKCRAAENEWIKTHGGRKPFVRMGIPF